MDKNDIIEYVMNTPHNTNKAVLSSMLNQLTEDGGGSGSSDFSTATVAVNYVGDYSASSIIDGYIRIFTDVEADSYAIYFQYEDLPGYLPVSALGTVNELKIPIYNEAKSDISQISFLGDGGTMTIELADSSVVSGSAEVIHTDESHKLFVWGDCVVNLTLVYQD